MLRGFLLAGTIVLLVLTNADRLMYEKVVTIAEAGSVVIGMAVAPLHLNPPTTNIFDYFTNGASTAIAIAQLPVWAALDQDTNHGRAERPSRNGFVGKDTRATTLA